MTRPILYLLLLILVATTGHAQDGLLDSTFADNGILKADVAVGNETIHEILEQPDGKLLTVMSSRYPEGFDIQLVRLNYDGSLDTTFADRGVYRKRNDQGSDLGYDLALLDDGSILACGSFGQLKPDDTDFHIFKLTSEGVLDSMFGDHGTTVIAIDTSEDYANAIAVAASGEIFLGGSSKIPGFGRRRDVVVKLTAAGKVDSTFGTAGQFVWNTSGVQTSEIRQLLLLEDGNLLTSGRTSPSGTDRISLYKVRADGSGLDSTFGVNGGVLAPIEGSGYGLALHPDGTILVAGNNATSEGFDMVVAAFDQTGLAKADFGNFGVATINPGLNDVGYAIAIQPDGKIIVAGDSGGNFRIPPPRAFMASRIDITGKIDSTWGTDGITLTPTSDFFAFANAVLIQRDGKVVLGGASATPVTQNDFTLIRYNNFIDADGDGFSVADDCNDFVFAINPDAFDIAGNGIDENCDGDDSPVAVQETPISSKFELFPNPASNEATIRTTADHLSIRRVDVYTVTGQLLASHTTGTNAEFMTLPLDRLPAGILLVSIQTDQGIAVKRIIKQ